jgi:nucleoside-diphosphate-sugar epimerase
MHSPAGSKERLKTLQRAMEFSPEEFIINAYLIEARIQKNTTAKMDALAARVSFYYYPGERRKAAIKAYIKVVRGRNIRGSADALADKYQRELDTTP